MFYSGAVREKGRIYDMESAPYGHGGSGYRVETEKNAE